MISKSVSKSDAPSAPLVQALRQARLRKGWSQREVSERAQLTQASISRIESGASDMRLSTLLEVARLLDLDLVLVPRTALSAVNAVLRDIEATEEARAVRGIANVLQQIVRQLRQRFPTDETVDRLADLTGQLDSLEPLFQRLPALDELTQLAQEIHLATRGSEINRPRLKDAVGRLAHLRNTLVHPLSQAERPAYTLDDED
jgi:transcriptional regulator with XRE-family HTH domain